MEVKSMLLLVGVIMLLPKQAFGSGCCSQIVTVGPNVTERARIMDNARRTFLDESTALPEGQLLKFRAFVKTQGRSGVMAQFGVWSLVNWLTYKTEYVFNVTFQPISGVQEFTVPDTVHVKNGSLFGVTFFTNEGFITHDIDVDNGRLMLTDTFTTLPSINDEIDIIYANYFHSMSLQVDVSIEKGLAGLPGPAGMTGAQGPAGATGPRGATGPAAADDINQCLENNGGCEMRCVDTEHGYHCECNPGYSINTDKHSCTNINECLKDNGGCNHFCNDTIGSYTCSCRHGYALSINNKQCQDIDECQINGACLTGDCINTAEDYICLSLGLQYDKVEGQKSKTSPLIDYNDDTDDNKKEFNPVLFTIIWMSLITALVIGLGVANIRYCRKRWHPTTATSVASPAPQEQLIRSPSQLSCALYI